TCVALIRLSDSWPANALRHVEGILKLVKDVSSFVIFFLFFTIKLFKKKLLSIPMGSFRENSVFMIYHLLYRMLILKGIRMIYHLYIGAISCVWSKTSLKQSYPRIYGHSCILLLRDSCPIYMYSSFSFPISTINARKHFEKLERVSQAQ
ncbi:hypothetical protein L9F63_005775, partial [Diploptera punctata]